MSFPIQINSRDFALTEGTRGMIERHAKALERYCERLESCHVVIEAPVHHHRHGGPFNVKIDLRSPGAELSVTHQSADEIDVAIRDAFDAARRRLEDHVQERRHEVKTHKSNSSS